jgi:predicted deacetylase
MKSLVVSLHDVSPLTQPLCAKIVLDLYEMGIGKMSLLIIPNHHGQAPITENSSFQRWLLAQVNAGNEPVLHGYFHRRPESNADSWLSRLTTEFYTAGEGEFFDLPFDRAKKLLSDGLADLAFLPRKVAGFIAPAWLLSEPAERAVGSIGFAYTTRIGSIRIFEPSVEIRSRSLVWSTRASWRIGASLCWNAALAIANSSRPVLRISIHPADVQHKPVWEQIHRIITLAVRQRECVSYEGLVGERIQNSGVRIQKAEISAPKGQEDSAQGFNPGKGVPPGDAP